MKKTLLWIFGILGILQITAQDMPTIKVGEDKLGITSLDVRVDVVGNIATTTYDMLFYNPTAQTLEGELAFPLAENQRVSRLALEVNGKLREAVVVEKELGRVAFEAVVRRGVDPVLLEKGTGNNYKARIYPIFPSSYKRVVLAHEQELIESEGDHFFQLPLGFKKNLDNFSIEMNIFDQKLKPELTKGSLSDFNFSNVENSYTASFSRANFTPSESLTIKIPQASDYAKMITSDDYFYSFMTLNATKRLRKKPENITLFWDVSLSMKDRLIDKEISVLDRYFNHLENVQVKVVSFSNEIVSEKWYSIANGKWDILMNDLKNSVYDGGTSFECLLENEGSDEFLIFSDGMKNLSHLKVRTSTPIFVINSLIKANHSELITICEASQGKYINLKSLSSDEAFEALNSQAFKFLGFDSSNATVEFYPKASVNVSSDFSVAGKGVRPGDTFVLKFGFGSEVTGERTITIKNSAENDLVKRFWAQKKLTVLQEKSDENQDVIVTHAKDYSLVSDHTSLIVLESVWDYVKYKITPPEELLEQYNRIIGEHKDKKVVSAAPETRNDDQENESSTDSISQESDNRVVTGSIRNGNISGNVSDATGPLPGVNIIVKGTSTGTQTDFDGNYSINASSGDDLVFSYVGYMTLETTIGASNRVNMSMVEDSQSLDEVIVTAQGIKREKKAIGFAVSEIKGEEISHKAEGDVARVLSGKASGVQITNQSGTSGSATNFIIRGYNSINGNNQALFIVDGVPFSNDTNTPQGNFASGNVSTSRLLDLDPNNIESIEVLKGLAAATLYGTAGRNGVVIITTKGGSDNISNPAVGSSNTEPYNRFVQIKKYIVDNTQTNTEYLRELKKAESAEDAYAIYLEQRHNYKDHPAYYIDVYDFFRQWNDQAFGQRILSNVAEIDFDNYELLRAFAYKLEEANNYPLAAFIFEQILKLRPEDAQSYRDLALAYKTLNRTSEAVALLNDIVTETLYSEQGRRKFEGMQTIAKNEMKAMVKSEALDKKALKLKGRDAEFDVRVVIDWNHNDTDIDLHVIDPNYEICSYENTKTKIKGRMSRDMTQGFGPEEFTLRKAKKGNYFIEVNYFGDNYQKIENPTFMKVTLFKNYGKPNETKEIKVVRLTEKRDKKVVAKLSI